MKKIINLLKGVLLGTLIVVFVCGCGDNTAQFVEKEAETSQALVENEVASQTELLDEAEGPNGIEDGSSKNEEALVCIYVCGAVEKPGVYELPEGSRVCDAFAAAGGLTEDACSAYWNQASVLKDGEMLYVPTIDEVESGTILGQDEEKEDNYDGNSKKININKASLEELMTIPGIGQAKAAAIIKYRQEHGVFSSIEEVKNVEGIKEGVYSKMKEYIDIN